MRHSIRRGEFTKLAVGSVVFMLTICTLCVTSAAQVRPSEVYSLAPLHYAGFPGTGLPWRVAAYGGVFERVRVMT
eukprot:scaffold269471_cov36-Prasinocladus_malaysianus.AAC.4